MKILNEIESLIIEIIGKLKKNLIPQAYSHPPPPIESFSNHTSTYVNSLQRPQSTNNNLELNKKKNMLILILRACFRIPMASFH